MPAGEMQSSIVKFFKHYNFKAILWDGNLEIFLKSQADIFLNFDIFDADEHKKNFDKLSNSGPRSFQMFDALKRFLQ